MSKFIGRGRIYVAERNSSGIPGYFHFVGCADAFTVELSAELTQHYSKCTSADALDFQRVRQQNANIALNLTEWSKKNLLIAFRGTEVPDATSGSATDESIGTNAAAGDVYLCGAATGFPKTNVSSVVVEKGGTPLVLDTDYTLNADTGTITFLVAQTGVLTVSYTYDMLPYVSLFTAGQKDYFVRFDGVNAANEDEACIFEAYKVQFNPAESLDLLPDELGLLNLTGAVLLDDTKPSAGDFGQFGRMSILS
jgi:hypothetical protein